MRRLVIAALAFPLLAGCGWPFFGGSPIVTRTPSHHICMVMTPDGKSHPCRPTPPRERAHTPLVGAGTLTDNANDSYVAWGTSLVSATESAVEIPVPTDGRLTNLRVRAATAPGHRASWTLTVDKNGTATALTCSIGGTATTCNDSSIVTVIAGDKIDLDVTPFGSPALATLTWSATLVPPSRSDNLPPRTGRE